MIDLWWVCTCAVLELGRRSSKSGVTKTIGSDKLNLCHVMGEAVVLPKL